MIASFRKEFFGFVATPYGMVFASSFLLLSGLTTALTNLFRQDSHFETTTLALLPWYLFFLLPLLTMRSLADERDTLPLLYTTATELWQIIVGKYLAIVALFVAVCAATLLYPLVYDFYSYVNWSNIASAYLGLLLFAALYSGIGLWVSSFSSSQASAAVLTALLFLALLLSGMLLPRLPQSQTSQVVLLAVLGLLALYRGYRSGLRPLLTLLLAVLLALLLSGLAVAQPRFLLGLSARAAAYISPLNRYLSFTQGLIRLADLVYFASSSALFVLLSVLQMEKRRWQ